MDYETVPTFIYGRQKQKTLRKVIYGLVIGIFFISIQSSHGEIEKVIVTSGFIYPDGTVEMDPWYVIDGRLELPLDNPGNIQILYLDDTGATVAKTGLDYEEICGPRLESSGGFCSDYMSFVLTIPYVEGVDKITISLEGKIIFEKNFSKNFPEVEIIFPNGAEEYHVGDPITARWESSDADGNELYFIISTSYDSGESWLPITLDWSGFEYTWKFYFTDVSDDWLLKIDASDGINTSSDVSDSTFSVLPWQPPKKQLDKGIFPRTVSCNEESENYYLMEKNNGKSAACVTKETSEILEARGWGETITDNTEELYIQNDPLCNTSWKLSFTDRELFDEDKIIETVYETIGSKLSENFWAERTVIVTEIQMGTFLVNSTGFFDSNSRQYSLIADELMSINGVSNVEMEESICK